MNSEKKPWWGTTDMPLMQVDYWCIGPLDLWVRRTEREWQVAFLRDKESDQETTSNRHNLSAIPDNFERFAFSETGQTLTLQPVLANRPLIVRPEKPFHVMPREEVCVYISSPLWLQIACNEPAAVLRELPVVELSDTWFGHSTYNGEWCYAARTMARLQLENLVRRPYRAITPVWIKNRGMNPLTVERIRVPLAYLDLYRDEKNDLWTQAIWLESNSGQGMAQMKIDSEPVSIGGVASLELVGVAREKPTKNIVVRTFGTIVGGELWKF